MCVIPTVDDGFKLDQRSSSADIVAVIGWCHILKAHQSVESCALDCYF